VPEDLDQVAARATTDTDAPGINVAATISRFSATGHRLLRRRFPLLVSMIAIVDSPCCARSFAAVALLRDYGYRVCRLALAVAVKTPMLLGSWIGGLLSSILLVQAGILALAAPFILTRPDGPAEGR
jgi:hypothetical protein